QHNLTAMNSNRMLGLTTKSQAKSTERLSSGYKINRAADDAAGLAISEKMRKQVRGLTQASTNAQDGISAVQTAEGALTEVHDMLQRMNELAVKSANGTNSEDDRSYIQSEVNALIEEINRVSETTKFNEIYLLKGDEEGTPKDIYSYRTESTEAKATFGDGVTELFVDGTKVTTEEALAAALDAKPDAVVSTDAGTKATAGTDYTKTVDGALIAGKDVYDATGTKITTDAALKTAMATGVYTDAGTKAVLGDVDTTTSNAYFAKKNIYNIDGTIKYAENANVPDADATGVTAFYTTAPTKAVADTDYTDKTTYALITGKTVYGADGEELDATTLAAAGKADAIYTTAPTKAGEDDYTFTRGTEGNVTLYDKEGKEVAAADLAEKLKAGELFTDKAATDAVTDATIEKYAEKTSINADLIFSLHVGADSTDNNKIQVTIASMSAAGIGVDGLKVDTEDTATDAINTISEALKQVSKQRSDLGAIQNRLEHTINNLDNVVENTTSAESAIRDTDMATEMVKYANNNILAQAGQAMLAQANQANQGVLSLLG
ncbi:MAG: hypothetical protein NC121_03785, partial [Blautia sp.]|nr:hypothetical protein [Blautia sp.]